MQDWNGRITEGMAVYTSDDHKLGKVVRTDGDSFIVEKGIFFVKDYVVAWSEVEDVSGGKVRLRVTADMLRKADEAEAARPADEDIPGSGATAMEEVRRTDVAAGRPVAEGAPPAPPPARAGADRHVPLRADEDVDVFRRPLARDELAARPAAPVEPRSASPDLDDDAAATTRPRPGDEDDRKV